MVKEKYLMPQVFLELSDIQKAYTIIEAEFNVQGLQITESGITVTLNRKDQIPALVKRLVEVGLEIFEVRSTGTMEDVFDRVIDKKGGGYHGQPE